MTEITFKDNGIEMNLDTLSGLFALNNALSPKTAVRQNGTGLRLVLCKEFINIHKGKIWTESELGKGRKFIFSIPLSLK